MIKALKPKKNSNKTIGPTTAIYVFVFCDLKVRIYFYQSCTQGYNLWTVHQIKIKHQIINCVAKVNTVSQITFM